MRQNIIRELQVLGFLDARHIGGDCNLSDLYTKEDKDINHFVQCRDATMVCPIIFTTQCTDAFVTKGVVRSNIPIARSTILFIPPGF